MAPSPNCGRPYSAVVGDFNGDGKQDIATANNDFPNPGAQNLAFDGTKIWVTVSDTDSVVALRASDAKIQGTFPVGDNPFGVAFDGANIWSSNVYNDNVTRLRARNGAITRTIPVGDAPADILYDGNSIWVVNTYSNSVSKISR